MRKSEGPSSGPTVDIALERVRELGINVDPAVAPDLHINRIEDIDHELRSIENGIEPATGGRFHKLVPTVVGDRRRFDINRAPNRPAV